MDRAKMTENQRAWWQQWTDTTNVKHLKLLVQGPWLALSRSWHPGMGRGSGCTEGPLLSPTEDHT